MAMTFSSKLGGIPLQSEQLAATIARLQQMQDDGGKGQKAFDQGMQRTENANKAMDNNATREDELTARKNKAKYEGADYAQKLKEFQLQNPTASQVAASISMGPTKTAPAPAPKANPLAGLLVSPGSGILGGILGN
jgi:hypothetical protein